MEVEAWRRVGEEEAEAEVGCEAARRRRMEVGLLPVLVFGEVWRVFRPRRMEKGDAGKVEYGHVVVALRRSIGCRPQLRVTLTPERSMVVVVPAIMVEMLNFPSSSAVCSCPCVRVESSRN